MSALAGVALTAFLALLAVPVLLLLLQVVSAIQGPPPPSFRASNHRPRIGVLVPAHNEATVIGRTLDCLRMQLAPTDRLLVVADNCTDGTARVAREAGCEVHERHDPDRRGKGYALDAGLRQLANDPPQIVVIVDADCLVEDGALPQLAQVSNETDRPVQALYLMHAAHGGGLMSRVAAFAWRVKNWVRPLGFHHLGLPCHLMGSGMAFPWHVISGAHLASGHIVEDLKLGMDLAREGKPPLFCPQARVFSDFPASATGRNNQRTRWEHGHLDMIGTDAARLLLAAMARRDVALFALALDLCVPPLALLVLSLAGAFLAAFLLYAASGQLAPLLGATGVIALFAVSIMQSWWHFGRDIVSFGNLMLAGWYALGKMPLYFKFLVHRQMEWVRSRRDSE